MADEIQRALSPRPPGRDVQPTSIEEMIRQAQAPGPAEPTPPTSQEALRAAPGASRLGVVLAALGDTLHAAGARRHPNQAGSPVAPDLIRALQGEEMNRRLAAYRTKKAEADAAAGEARAHLAIALEEAKNNREQAEKIGNMVAQATLNHQARMEELRSQAVSAGERNDKSIASREKVAASGQAAQTGRSVLAAETKKAVAAAKPSAPARIPAGEKTFFRSTVEMLPHIAASLRAGYFLDANGQPAKDAAGQPVPYLPTDQVKAQIEAKYKALQDPSLRAQFLAEVERVLGRGFLPGTPVPKYASPR